MEKPVAETAFKDDLLTRREAIRRVSALLGGAALIGQSAWLAGCAAPQRSSASLFTDSDVDRVDIEAESATHPLRSPDDWWAMVRGSGYRGTIELMNEQDRARVKDTCLEYIRQSAVTAVEANVVYGLATRAV